MLITHIGQWLFLVFTVVIYIYIYIYIYTYIHTYMYVYRGFRLITYSL